MDIRIISAPSILGLKPSGVQLLGKTLLDLGLAALPGAKTGIVKLPDPNKEYSFQRDPATNCLNAPALKDFCLELHATIKTTVANSEFPLVLGGDCSILIGVMSALKTNGRAGLLFLDAHADFYSPETSVTGELADMDLAIVAGYGPPFLTNINDLGPYVDEEDIIHVGQRDQDETQKYNSPDIHQTEITCISASDCGERGASAVAAEVKERMINSPAYGFWIHFDTDVLNDDLNPAVDYRLPGGLLIDDVHVIVSAALSTGKCIGMSVTIYNPRLDAQAIVGRRLVAAIERFFSVS